MTESKHVPKYFRQDNNCLFSCTADQEGQSNRLSSVLQIFVFESKFRGP